MICGAVKCIDGNPDPLVCSKDAGHVGDHAAGIATWPESWTVAPPCDDGRAWYRKPHVRRAYQTLTMWKAGQ
jgi:hypothetical protein